LANGGTVSSSAITTKTGLDAIIKDIVESLLPQQELQETVSNAHFDNYPQKTIGEYFDLYEDKFGVIGEWDVPEPTKEWEKMMEDTSFDSQKEYLVKYGNTEKNAITFLFSCDKKTNRVTLKKIIASEGNEATQLRTKTAIDEGIEMFVKSVS
jgi:hypothetical protein